MLMTLDKDALDLAQTARDRLFDLQHQAEVARVDYHHSIRRLHAKGGSLREIADSLGLSHQRVHQIVEPVDGSSGPHHGPPHARPGGGPRGPLHMHRVIRRLRAFAGFERFTAEARDVVAAAVHEAERLGHRRVGTEHLLIGAAGDGTSVAGVALASLGADRDAIRTVVSETLVGGGAGPQRRPFTPAARRVLDRSLRIVEARGEREIRAHHVLLAILDDAGDAAALLARMGHDADTVRAAVEAAAATPE